MIYSKRTHKLRIILIMTVTMLSVFLLAKSSFTQGAQVTCPSTTLRVALGVNLTSAELAVSDGSYELVDYLTQRVISSDPANGKWVVAPAGSFNLQIYNNGLPVNGLGSSLVILRQKGSEGRNVFSFKNKRYRGELLIENLQGKVQMINLVDVEQYLYGVVGAEMGPGALEEAYKVQAIVSRTYALFYKHHPQLNYDVGISTRWQVYGGYDTEILSSPLVKKAVDETCGKVIYYDNEIIQAFFHSNSGGYSEACENVWVDSLPYIQPIATPEDALAIQAFQQESWAGETYQWEKNFTRQELNNQVTKWNRENPSNTINVGEIYELAAGRLAIDPQTREYLAKQTPSGRITQLDFRGARGTKSFYKDNIRSVLGVKSTLFEIVCDSTVKIWNAFGTTDLCSYTPDFYAVNADGYQTKLNGNSGSYYVLEADGVKTVPKVFSQLTIKGKGYGHGLGMSQWGARGMALQGVKHSRIIEHFYNQDKFDGRLTISSYRP